ncbi:MAG: pyridoxal-phosphate dependent enzyme, partial [Bacillota bacterium]
QVTGVSVNISAATLRRKIRDVAERAAQLANLKIPLALDDVRVTDTFVGPGYGVATPEALEAVRLVAKTEGVLLDPVYTGKAMAALIASVRSGKIPSNSTVLFVHTGGIPNLFYHADALTDMSHRGDVDDGN